MTERTFRASQRHTDDECGSASNVLDALTWRGFMLSVERAEREALKAVETRERMLSWARRLEPYFAQYPEATVAEALRHYNENQTALRSLFASIAPSRGREASP